MSQSASPIPGGTPSPHTGALKFFSETRCRIRTFCPAQRVRPNFFRSELPKFMSTECFGFLEGVVIMTVPSAGGAQISVALPFALIHGFLFGIKVNMVKAGFADRPDLTPLDVRIRQDNLVAAGGLRRPLSCRQHSRDCPPDRGRRNAEVPSSLPLGHKPPLRQRREQRSRWH